MTLRDAQSAQYTQEAGAAAGVAVTAAALPGVALLAPAVAGPIGLAVAGVTLLVSALIANSGCGPTCILATRIVDDLEKELRANRDAYLNAGSRTADDQVASLAAFDYAWQWLSSSQACGNAELGDAGKRCISDRARGGKWDWFVYYRDPIAAAAPTTTGSTLDSAAAAAGIPPAVLIAAGLAVVGILL